MVKKQTNKFRLRVTDKEYAAYIGFYASWARHCNISKLQIPASVPADEYLSAFVHNFNNIFSISSGYRRTEW